jgi:hypothetical protein
LYPGSQDIIPVSNHFFGDRHNSPQRANVACRLLITTMLLASAYWADAQSITSPDGKWIVFVKTVSGPMIDYGGSQARGADPDQPTELWQIDSHNKNPTLLVKCRRSDIYEQMIVGFENLHFSANGRLVYFDSPVWARNGAVHVVDTTTRKEHFICDGSLEDVQHSESGDLLVVNKGKYDPPRGKFFNAIPDYYQNFLVTLDGREIKAIGEQVIP